MNSLVLKALVFNLIAIGFLASCKNSGNPSKSNSNNFPQKVELKKPPSTFQDSLFIDELSVVFYQPDSIQLLNIKNVTEEQVFESSMHEYFYLTRNAHNVLRQHWPKLKIIDSKNVRYLLFIKNNKGNHIIDLDEYGDAYGMFMFDPKRDPMVGDMANLDEALLYFSK